jgi:hypothetical protein
LGPTHVEGEAAEMNGAQVGFDPFAFLFPTLNAKAPTHVDDEAIDMNGAQVGFDPFAFLFPTRLAGFS